MSIPDNCCRLPPVSSDYQPQGKTIQLGDLTIYESPNQTGDTLLISAYDIFGFHQNVKQFADKMASTGHFRVALPDFFKTDKRITRDDLKGDRSKLYEFVMTYGNWDKTVKTDVVRVIEHYKSQGVTKFGVYGFCWGGKIGARSVAELADDIKAAVLIHPSLLTDQDAEEAKAPVLFLPAKDDPDLTEMCKTVKKNLGEENADLHVFDDMVHGFCGAGGDWSQELQSKRVNEAINMTHGFFKKHLLK